MSAFKFRNIDDDLDYTAKRDEEAVKGNFPGAEYYERGHNAKVDKLGLPYPKTHKYIDLGIENEIAMRENAPGSVVKDNDNYRINKALTTPGLEQYAYDEKHDAAVRYYYNDLMGVGGNYQNKPVYDNKYGAKVDELFDRVMNGEKFSYDVESDPSYQSYKDMYTREGNRAMQDTLAQVAQNAGGNNSYAVSAAAQANNYYMQQLADKVPELYNAAYNRYMNEENLKRQDLEIARMLQSDDYNRYLGDMGIFQTNVGLANNLYNSQLDREYQERAWNYGVEQDDKNWTWLEEDRDYTRAEKAKAQARETALMKIQAGEMPSETELAAAGWTAEDWQSLVDIYGEMLQESNKTTKLNNILLEKQINNASRAYSSGGVGSGAGPMLDAVIIPENYESDESLSEQQKAALDGLEIYESLGNDLTPEFTMSALVALSKSPETNMGTAAIEELATYLGIPYGEYADDLDWYEYYKNENRYYGTNWKQHD